MNEVFWSPGISLEAMEEMIIKRAYTHYQNNKMTTCKSLGIAIRTLENKLEKYAKEEEILKEAREIQKKKDEQNLLRARMGAHYDSSRSSESDDSEVSALPNTSPVQVTTLKKRAK